jgi:hypothetical protein
LAGADDPQPASSAAVTARASREVGSRLVSILVRKTLPAAESSRPLFSRRAHRPPDPA